MSESKCNEYSFEALGQSLKPHPSKTKILVEVGNEIKVKTAVSVLENMGIDNIEHHIPCRQFPEWVVFLVYVEDVKELILGLSEAGFERLKGIGPGKKDSG